MTFGFLMFVKDKELELFSGEDREGFLFILVLHSSGLADYWRGYICYKLTRKKNNILSLILLIARMCVSVKKKKKRKSMYMHVMTCLHVYAPVIKGTCKVLFVPRASYTMRGPRFNWVPLWKQVLVLFSLKMQAILVPFFSLESERLLAPHCNLHRKWIKGQAQAKQVRSWCFKIRSPAQYFNE